MSRARGAAMGRQPPVAFLTLIGLVIAGALSVRLALLGRQSYWIDELFSVSGSAGTFPTMLQIGSTEVHTPFYPALLWAWIRIGGTHEAWTRSLSTLCAVAAVVITYRGLRAVRLCDHVRWALTAATAASGASIVYSLESRSYAVLVLGSVGLTAATVRAAVLTLDGGDVRRGTLLSWVGWSVLAATAHPFGALLTIGAVTVLAAVTLRRARRPRARRVLRWMILGAAGCSLQAAWILRGLTVPKFGSGTGWIEAPGGQDVWELVTTTFSSGDIVAHKDGFALTSPFGAIGAATLCLAAALWGYRSRAQATPQTEEARAAAILLSLAAVVVVPSFVGSQWLHVWTLRNMLIVTPALMWGVICLAASAARTVTGRRGVATAAVALLGVSLVPTAIGLARPYKTDFRGMYEYLISVRAREQEATFTFVGRAPPWGYRAADWPGDDLSGNTLYPNVNLQPVNWRKAGVRTSGTQVVIVYRSVAQPRVNDEVSILVGRLGDASCRAIPLYGLGVVRCN